MILATHGASHEGQGVTPMHGSKVIVGQFKDGGFRVSSESKIPRLNRKSRSRLPVVAGEVEYITIEAKHRGRGRCFHRAMNFLDCLGKRIFYGGHS